MEVILGVIALALGLVLGVLWSSSRSRATYEALLQEKAALAASLDAERRGGAEKLSVLQDAETKLREAFAALSSQALQQNNESFLHLARTSFAQSQQGAAADLEARKKEIAALVEPMSERLKQLDDHLRSTEKDQATLHGHLQAVAETQEVLRLQTQSLVNALKSPNQRGRWGQWAASNSFRR